jgi:hypothetical protein
LILAGVVFTALSPPALAIYQTIEHNLLDGIPETSYTGGVLSLSSPADANNDVFLYDPVQLPGVVTNTSVSLTMSFDGYDVHTGRAVFSDGIFSLKFDYNGVAGFELSGPVHLMLLEVFVDSPSLSFVFGEGLFTAETVNLPGSNEWPDGGGRSLFDHLGIAFPGVDLTGFDWTTDTFTDGDGLYSLIPGPEPGTLGLVALGVVLVVVRRRRPTPLS